VLNRGDHMDRYDCNIIVVFVLGVLNRGHHMDRFDLIEVTTSTGLTVISWLCLF
jgi:hypothetical protein